MAPLPIDIGDALARCVKAAGGVVLEEHLAASPGFENADYLFETEAVVAELKTLSEDTVSAEQFIGQVSALYRQWVQAGKIAPAPTGRHVIHTRDLPEDCARQYLQLLRKRIRRLVARANNQIKLTKAHLGIPDAAGLLLIANDGDFVMKPYVVMHLLAHLLTPDRYKSIDAITYFTANQTMRVHDVADSLVWLGCRVPGRREIARGLKDRLRGAWLTEYTRLTGETIDEKAWGATMDTVEQMEFESNPRSQRSKKK